jgi:hypothetical protein
MLVQGQVEKVETGDYTRADGEVVKTLRVRVKDRTAGVLGLEIKGGGNGSTGILVGDELEATIDAVRAMVSGKSGPNPKAWVAFVVDDWSVKGHWRLDQGESVKK